MSQNYLPTIPSQEYKQRWEKIQNVMDNGNLDMIIAYSNDRSVFGQAHARWIADYPVHLEPVIILMFKEGNPVMTSGIESIGYIKKRSKVSEVYAMKEFTLPEEEYSDTNVKAFADIISEKIDIKKIKKVGIAGIDIMDINTWTAIQAFLGPIEWVDIENKMCELRAIKTPDEIKVLRYTYKIANKAFEAAVAAIKPGVTEMEVAAEADYIMRKAGAEEGGIDTMVSSGPNCGLIISRSTSRRIEENDIVRVVVAPKYEGYNGAISRPIFVGKPDKKMKEIYDLVCSAREACLLKVKAGEKGSVVEGSGRNLLKEAGFEYSYSGVHSVGVKEFEYPIYGPKTKGELKEGMVISIEVPLFEQSWGGFHTEDGCIVKNNGAEILNNTLTYIEK